MNINVKYTSMNKKNVTILRECFNCQYNWGKVTINSDDIFKHLEHHAHYVWIVMLSINHGLTNLCMAKCKLVQLVLIQCQ